MSKVINVKVAHLRKMKPRYENLEGWLSASKKHIYIGRNMSTYVKGAYKSEWANPFTVKECGSNTEACKKYKKYLSKKLKKDPLLRKQLRKLDGKILGCWCVEKPIKAKDKQSKIICHGQILMQLLDKYRH